jgi:hypothetical protein
MTAPPTQQVPAEMLRLSDLPSLTTRPEGAVISRQARRARSRLARREFIRIAGAAALGTGLGFAGLFATARPAHAGHARPCWRESQYCTNPSGSHPQCGTSSSYISTTHCASSGWHRHDTRHEREFRIEWQLRNTSCNGRNAWRWNAYRCSDGRWRTCYYPGPSCTSWSPTVCPRGGSPSCPPNP